MSRLRLEIKQSTAASVTEGQMAAENLTYF